MRVTGILKGLIAQSRFFSEQALLGIFLAALATVLVVTSYLWEWDQIIYDYTIKGDQRAAPDDVVIVAIDQNSLNQLGRWPWPRRLHTALINRLSDYQSGPVGVDIIFSEPSQSPEDGDQALADAVAEHGKVVLPIIFEQLGNYGQFTELLPFSPLDTNAELGHADMDLDRDGIARSVYLQAGIDGPFWPSFALRLLRLSRPDALAQLPGLRGTESTSAPHGALIRDHQIWIPFAGPPGHFTQISYADVLAGRIDPQQIRNKIVLVGFTAAGLDVVPTPVSAERRPMPGVEIHANILDTLRRELWIEPLNRSWQVVLTLAFVLLPLFIYPRVSPRFAPLVACVSLVPPILATLGLLRYGQVWFPPVAAILTIVLGYLFWSWRRLHTTLRYLNQELIRLNREPSVFPRIERPDLAPMLNFLQHVLPIAGCTLQPPSGIAAQAWGSAPPPPETAPADLPSGKWHRGPETWWLRLTNRQGQWLLGVTWRPNTNLSPAQMMLVADLIEPYLSDTTRRPVTPVEILQARIQQVQRASERMRLMRAFFTDSVAQMANGVLVSDCLGQVLLHNPQSAHYLANNTAAQLNGKNIGQLFGKLHFNDSSEPWQNRLSKVLIDGEQAQFPARTETGEDLLVQMAPFADEQNHWRGLVVNFSDVSQLRASERKRAEMLGFLSHDLRSPLASVMALTQLARYKPEQLINGRIVDQIEERTRATLSLVDDFLQLARAENMEETVLGDVDIAPLAEEAIEQVRPLAESKSSHLTASIQCSEAWIYGNSGLLRRMFTNLLSNAIKYSPENATIELSVTTEPGSAICTVKDNGYGIDEKYLSTLFDRFQRIHREEHQQEQGTGLGLAFVKTVVDRHLGKIEVASELNNGTTFTLRLPLQEFSELDAAR